MNLPPDKVKLLCQYDNEKKWELVCDQERFQVKNPPSAYIQKLKSVLEQGGGRKFKRRVQESTQVLRELEISLRTNHIGWAEEFLNEENKGLDVLVDYLSFAQRAVTYDMDSSDNGSFEEKSVEDLTTSATNSPTHNSPRSGRPFTTRKALRYSRLLSQKNHLHLCIMCLRAIMNYQLGFNQVMAHPNCVNEITLSLNNKNARTKALVLELLAAVCLVRGGHEMIIAAFNNFKEVCGEKNRFEKLMEYYRNDDNNIDFMVACMQFINIVVHSVENMNFRVYLQHEFTQLGLDSYLEELTVTESERLQVQIQAYLDNVFDVGAMLEDAEAKNTIMEHLEELQEQNTQLNTRLQQCESEAVEKTSELEKQLIQSRKEVELLKDSVKETQAQLSQLQQKEKERETHREKEQERERDRQRSAKALTELEKMVQVLVDRGLIRMDRSESGSLELHIMPAANTTDVRSLEKGMEVVRKEFLQQKDSAVLTNFMSNNGSLLDSVVKDSKTAEEVYHSVVEYFGEDPKSTPPSVFFPVFARFIKAYKLAEQEKEQRKKNISETDFGTDLHISDSPVNTAVTNRMPALPRFPQMDLIAELKRRQMTPLVREGKDGAIEDIITDLRKQPYIRADGGRRSAKWKPAQQLPVSSDISL
ncbi:formin-like protein 1 [Sinocyclocheilus rhinocerous]|uniref:formin-like protein 1 n=1 Tax=Sinocyclocheilus rhinocerous TaxID=307959 RepID=UPI0007B88F06|nr:PREDICTED: formin-like protein 1 [Sinocyclocheilus rhinocerous]